MNAPYNESVVSDVIESTLIQLDILIEARCTLEPLFSDEELELVDQIVDVLDSLNLLEDCPDE